MDVTRVAVPASTRASTGTTNAYLLGREDAVLVDPAARTDRLDEQVADRSVGHVAVTHHHADHVDAVAHYAAETGATVWARRGRVPEFTDATGVTPDRTFGDGTTLRTGNVPVRVCETPGHAPEHVAFEAGDAFVCGDLAVAEGSVVVGAPEGDMRAYLSSLRRVLALTPDTLASGHGPVIEGDKVPATLIRLLGHRLDREARIRDAVVDGTRTPAKICDVAYDKDLSGVRDLAEATVVAHLEKLGVEGDIRWDGDRAVPA